MSLVEVPLDVRGLARLYAALAHTFRYPEKGEAHFLEQTEYLRAFDPAVSPAAVSLQESSYVECDVSALLEDLVRFYEHFGLRRRQEALLPDHLSVELEFMHFLCEREAGARSEHDTDSLRRAQIDFLDRHLLRLVAAVAERGNALDSSAAREATRACHAMVMHHRGMLGSGGHGGTRE